MPGVLPCWVLIQVFGTMKGIPFHYKLPGSVPYMCPCVARTVQYNGVTYVIPCMVSYIVSYMVPYMARCIIPYVAPYMVLHMVQYGAVYGTVFSTIYGTQQGGTPCIRGKSLHLAYVSMSAKKKALA